MVMAMNMQCPECGHEFEIEESQQAQDNQAKALEAQEKEFAKKLIAQKTELEAAHEKKKSSDINAEVEKQVKEKQAKALAVQEKEFAKKLIAQKTELEATHEKKKSSDINAEVEKQVKEKEVTWKKNANRETQEFANKRVDKEIQPYIAKEGEYKLQIERLTTSITKLEQQSTRSQMPEIKGESAELRLKKQLIDRFKDMGDRTEDIRKGKSGADFKHYVNHEQQEIGMMLIERKSTKSFQETWITKLKKDMEKSEANIGVIVTDNMAKKHKGVGIYKEISDIFVLKAVGAIDYIFLLRELMITNRNQEGYKKLSQDEKVLLRVFEYIGKGKGKGYVEEWGNSIVERNKLKNDRNTEHKKWMKKEENSILNQAENYMKLIKGFNEASQNKLNLIDAKILITDETVD